VTGNRLSKVLKIALLGVIAIAVFGFVVMRLWNWLMPALFSLHPVTFWQALGLLVLGKILFGGFRGGHSRRGWRGRIRERWQHMTPEEREKFRAGIGHRCGAFSQQGTEAKL